MWGNLQYKEHLDQDLEDWSYSRGSQTDCGLFSEEEKQESIGIEDSDPEVEIISNQDPEGGKSTMVVVKWSDKVEGSVENIDAPLWGRLYKEEDNFLVPWSGKDPDAKMNCFTWSKYDNDWIVPEDQYNGEFKN